MPVYDPAGVAQGLVFSLFDTTSRKQGEMALVKARDELEAREQNAPPIWPR